MKRSVALLPALTCLGLAGGFTEWTGWGGSTYNDRWVRDSAVNAASASSASIDCQLTYLYGESAPATIDGNIAYYPTWNGLLVALDYTCCKVVWQTNITERILAFGPLSHAQELVTSPVARTSPALQDGILYIGTQTHALFMAVNATDGTVLGTKQINDHPLSVITQSPTYYDGRIFVGVSSTEETAAAIIKGYKCCSFAGSFMALTFDSTTGTFSTTWEVSMLPTPARGWAGNSVWGSQPSIDEKRSQVFIGTGNVYTAPKRYSKCSKKVGTGAAAGDCLPKRVYQEAVLALDVSTGHVNWVRRLAPLDAWTVACVQGVPGSKKNCPPSPGPDADFGMAPAFIEGSAYTPGGNDTLVLGQKNGNLYALSAADGTVEWATHTSPDGLDGGLSWGVAVDETTVYYTAVNYLQTSYKLQPSGKTIHNSAWGAANLTDGSFLWQTQVPGALGFSQVPPTITNGIVVTGRTALNITGKLAAKGGMLAMLDGETGNILSTLELDTPIYGGIVVQDEYLLFGTGYAPSTFTKNATFHVVKVSQ